MMLLRVEPLEPGEQKCQVNEFICHDGLGNATAIVIGQFFLGSGIVEIPLCAGCWREILEAQQGGEGWMYMPDGPCQCCVNNECDCQPTEEAKEEGKPTTGSVPMVAEL